VGYATVSPSMAARMLVLPRPPVSFDKNPFGRATQRNKNLVVPRAQSAAQIAERSGRNGRIRP
jgi:hypothetical protein